MKIRNIGIVAVLSALLWAGCSENVLTDEPVAAGDDFVDVAISLIPSIKTADTRVVGDVADGVETTIGNAHNIDMLVYAVYLDTDDMEGHPQTLLTQYGRGLIYADGIDENSLPEAKKERLESIVSQDKPHTGQTIVYVGDSFDDEGYTLTLRLMRNESYRIAFWAQSSEAIDAFDTDDLREVKIDYSNAVNNDDLRDVFCKTEVFSLANQASSLIRDVSLTRPFAQINVGTTGADFLGHEEVSKTQITLKGVANQINVVEDKIADTTEEVTFAWNDIPSEYLYVNMDDHGANGHAEDSDNGGYHFLRYKSDYPTIDTENNNAALTETFKYLTMCYVLVPADVLEDSGDTSDDGNFNPTYRTAEIESATVEFATADGTVVASKNIVKLPVRRNWRSNILGGLGTADDPKSIFGDDPAVTTNN